MPWQNPINKENNYKQAGLFLLGLALLSLAFQVRFVNTLAVMSLVGIVLFRKDGLQNLKTAFANPFFLGCFFLLVMQAIGLLYTENETQTIRKLEMKTGLVAIPFFFCAGNKITLSERRWLMQVFNTALVVVTLICLFMAFMDYISNHDKSVFFYHRLVRPFSHHAIYFSFYLLFCIIFWIERGFVFEKINWVRTATILFVVYDVLLIILLSSKIVIGLLVLYLLFVLARLLLKKANVLVMSLGLVLLFSLLSFVFLTNSPVKQRFSEIAQGSLGLLRQDKFSPDMYFNGLQLRLLNWRFSFEILKSEKAWMMGVGPGDAMQKLNEKYISMNMYKGEGDTDRGYLSYNCHNQFLETSLQSGIVGLLILSGIFISLFILIRKRNSAESCIVFLSILAFSFTESLLETQYGIFLFSFFPLLAFQTDQNTQDQ
jgi:O-antigen ligase